MPAFNTYPGQLERIMSARARSGYINSSLGYVTNSSTVSKEYVDDLLIAICKMNTKMEQMDKKLEKPKDIFEGYEGLKNKV